MRKPKHVPTNIPIKNVSIRLTSKKRPRADRPPSQRTRRTKTLSCSVFLPGYIPGSRSQSLPSPVRFLQVFDRQFHALGTDRDILPRRRYFHVGGFAAFVTLPAFLGHHFSGLSSLILMLTGQSSSKIISLRLSLPSTRSDRSAEADGSVNGP